VAVVKRSAAHSGSKAAISFGRGQLSATSFLLRGLIDDNMTPATRRIPW